MTEMGGEGLARVRELRRSGVWRALEVHCPRGEALVRRQTECARKECGVSIVPFSVVKLKEVLEIGVGETRV